MDAGNITLLDFSRSDLESSPEFLKQSEEFINVNIFIIIFIIIFRTFFRIS